MIDFFRGGSFSLFVTNKYYYYYYEKLIIIMIISNKSQTMLYVEYKFQSMNFFLNKLSNSLYSFHVYIYI